MSRLALSLALLLAAAPARAQQAPVPIPYDGTEVFGHILKHYKLDPVPDPSSFDPAQAVVIVFGDPGNDLDKRLPMQWVPWQGRGHSWRSGNDLDKRLPMQWLRGFLQRGANVLVAGETMTQVAPGLTLGEEVLVPAELGYRGQAACPWIATSHLAQGHPIFLGVQQGLATNCPRSLRVDGEATHRPLAWLPVRSSQARKQNEGGNPWVRSALEFLGRFGDPIYMAGSPADAPPTGRVLVLGGHGVFMNCMLVQRDCDNFQFACNCVHWLCEGKNGQKRKKALFLVNGRVIDNFQMSLLPPPPPVPMPTAALLDRLLASWEDEGFFRRLLFSEPDLPALLARGLLMTATLLLLLYGARKLLAGRYHAETAVPLLVGPAAAADGPPVGLERRHEELLARGNLHEAAQALARAWFHAHAAIVPSRWFGDLRDTAPDVVITGSFWRRWQLQRQLAWAWNVAQSGSTVRVSKRGLRVLARALANLTEAAEAGELRLQGKE